MKKPEFPTVLAVSVRNRFPDTPLSRLHNAEKAKSIKPQLNALMS